jgi:hypothetical protein
MVRSVGQIPRNAMACLGRAGLFGWCVAVALGWTSGACRGECETIDAVVLKTLGLEIPAGAVVAGDGLRVVTHDAAGNVVVARLHVSVGDRRIVLLPDGRLVVRTPEEAPLTQRPFVPATKEQMIRDLAATGLAGFQTRQTGHYLYAYNASEEFAEITSRILETMLQGVMTYAQVQGIEVHAPEIPLMVIIARTPDEFQALGRMPEGVVAYYNLLSNRIVMYEQSPLWRVKPELAVREALATIAHEGAHQILHNIGVQERLSLWPMWLNEGLAEFFAPTTTDRHLKWKGAGQVNDMRMFELEQWLQSPSADDANGQLVSQTVGAARLTSTGYAAAWALTHYVAQNQRESFHAVVRRYSTLKPLKGHHRIVPPGVIPENVRVFKEHFGDDMAETERCLVQHLKNLPYTDPFVDWPHFVALVAIPDGRRTRREARVFHLQPQATEWCQQVTDRTPEPQRAGVQSAVREFPNRVLAEAFARQWRDSP